MFIQAFICLFAQVPSLLTMESTKKLQAMISAVSKMLLKGLHCATSKANYEINKQETLERTIFNTWQTKQKKTYRRITQTNMNDSFIDVLEILG